MSSFLTNHVEFVVVGGYAVSFHGYSRFTEDLDLFLDSKEPNREYVKQALREIGYEVPTTGIAEPGTVIRIGNVPFRIDLLPAISGPTYSEVSSDATAHPIEGAEYLSVRVISLAQLRLNKRASGRMKDLADLEELPESS